MTTELTQVEQISFESLAKLKSLRRLEASPSVFWPALLEAMGLYFDADACVLLVRDEDFTWQRLCAWPQGSKFPKDMVDLDDLAARAETDGFADEPDVDSMYLFAGHFDQVQGQASSVLLLSFNTPVLEKNRLIERFAPLTDIPLDYSLNRNNTATGGSSVRAVEALDLMLLLNDSKYFMQAAMTLCNEVANRYACDRISLGWLQQGYVRLQSLSHMEQFDRKMALVQEIEAVMEEALDQDAEVLWPRPENETVVVREHEAFAVAQRVGNVLSVPLRLDGEPVAVLLCERRGDSFTDDEVLGLRIICDQVVRRLSDLYSSSRWIGARCYTALERGLEHLIGPEHTLPKVIVILFSLLLGFMLFGSWHYRVDANFILRTEDLTHVPAPYEGYIEDVHAEVGDLVKKGDLLLELRTDTLLLQESEAIADMGYRAREEEKARAAQQLADMRIAAALKDQVAARLEEIRYNLSQARLLAPMDGIVVEGDLKEMRGAPVKKGDALFTVAALDRLYVELNLDERDIQEVAIGYDGMLSFLSRPDLEFAIQLRRIYPAAQVKEGQNRFLIKAELTEEIQTWWRPGMSGVARIDVGPRTPMWVLMHRTIDYLRLALWW